MKLNTITAIVLSGILIGLLIDMAVDINYHTSLVRYIMDNLK